MDNNTLLILMASLFVVTVLIILIIVLNNSKKTNDLNNELSRSIYEIRSNISRDFMDLDARLNNEFHDFSDRVNSNIIQSNKASNEVFHSISEKMAKINEAQDSLNEMSKDIISLEDILTDKKSRGAFGEVELYSLLQSVYGENSSFYEKQYRLPNGFIADAVIKAEGSFDLLCIDSKFPLENYRNMLNVHLDEKSRQLYERKFKEDIRKHIDDIHRKYIIPGLTADLAYMFIPAEAVFARIYGSFPELVDLSYEKKVYIVSPTTLMAYITAMRSIYLGRKKDEKARQIAVMLADLSVEFKRFEKRSEEIYKVYENLNSAFYDLNVSSRKIIRRFDKINAGEFEEEEEKQ